MVGAWWLLLRKDYFVQVSGGRYEYFGDLSEARSYAKREHGTLYEIPAGSEFSEKSAKRLTPNRSRKRRRR